MVRRRSADLVWGLVVAAGALSGCDAHESTGANDVGVARQASSEERRSVLVVMAGEPALAALGGRDPSDAAARKIVQARAIELADRQARVLDDLEAVGATVVGRTVLVANAMHVRATDEQLRNVATVDGVIRLERPGRFRLTRSRVVPHVGAPVLWNATPVPYTGAAMKIGILDSGIDYTHADFGGTGDPAVYAGNDRAVVETGSFPTARVVGGIDLAGDNYDASGTVAEPEPTPDPDPLDCMGHGTHVAGIAAGGGVAIDGTAYAGPYDMSLDPTAFSIGPGVAPNADLFAVKIFGCSDHAESELLLLALEYAADPNGDLDTSDRLDVVNASFSAEPGTDAAIEATAITMLAAGGTAFVASSGNQGTYYRARFSVGHPASVPQAIAVGSSLKEEAAYSFQALTVTSPASVAGTYPLGLAEAGPSLGRVGPISAPLVVADPPEACEALSNAAEAKNAIVLVDRGACSFADKFQFAGDAGAAAIIVVDNVEAELPLDEFGQGAPSDIPGFGMRNVHGNALKAAGSAAATLDAGATAEVSLGPDYVAEHTSRGPAPVGSALKPDVVAPGLDVISSARGTGSGAMPMSGTSMATPVVAGAVALLRQAHPSLTPNAIKELLMASAAPVFGVDETFPTSLRGAGRIDVERAIASSVSLRAANDPGVGVSFGGIAKAYEGIETREIVVTNHGATEQTFSVGAAPDRDVPGVIVSTDPPQITVPPFGTGTFALSLEIAPSALPPQPTADGFTPLNTVYLDEDSNPADAPRHSIHEVSGDVELFTDGVEERVATLPYFAAVRAASDRIATVVRGCVPLGYELNDVTLEVEGESSTSAVATSVLELGTTTSQFSAEDGVLAHRDILAVGAAVDVLFEPERVFFGGVLGADWTTPALGRSSALAFEIDRNADGYADFLVGLEGLLPDGPSYQDVVPNDLALVVVTDLLSGDTTTRAYPANGAHAPAPGGTFYDGTLTHDTQLFYSNVVVMPVLLEDLGIVGPNEATIHYRGVTGRSRLDFETELEPSVPTDVTDWVLYEVDKPNTVTATGFDGTPLFVGTDPIRIGIRHTATPLLVLHHANERGARHQILDMRGPGLEAGDLTVRSDPDAFVLPGDVVTVDFVIDNDGPQHRSDVAMVIGGDAGMPLAVTTSDGACTLAQCTFGDLAPGDVRTISTQWTFDEPGSHNVSAIVTGAIDCEVGTGPNVAFAVVNVTGTLTEVLPEDGDCDCRMVGNRNRGSWLVGALLIGAALIRRQKRAT